MPNPIVNCKKTLKKQSSPEVCHHYKELNSFQLLLKIPLNGIHFQAMFLLFFL